MCTVFHEGVLRCNVTEFPERRCQDQVERRRQLDSLRVASGTAAHHPDVCCRRATSQPDVYPATSLLPRRPPPAAAAAAAVGFRADTTWSY